MAGHPVDMPVAAVQYLNSHDHSHWSPSSRNQQNPYDGWPIGAVGYKISPSSSPIHRFRHAMLWQGQEFSENYVLANDGTWRVHFRQ